MSRLVLALFVLVFATAQSALAQSWPSRAVRIIVPFPPGGGTDVFARAIAAHLSETTKQPFVVENRTGAGGIIGSDAAAKAPADGYTLLFGTNGPLIAVKYMSQKLPYDPIRDFAPISMVAEVPIAIMVNAKQPIHSLRELLDQARAKPGHIAYASPGPATTGHIGGEWLKKLTGVDMTHVPYRGSAPVATDLVAGQVPVAVDSVINFMAHIRSGAVRVLAVATPARFGALPEVPTAKELGLDMQITLWFALVAPAATPKEIVQRLNRDVDAYVKRPEFSKLLEPHAAQPMGGSTQDAERYLAGEAQRWSTMIQSTGIKMD